MTHTIVALATPIGRSGIGVVRLSGNRSLVIARKLTCDSAFDPRPRTAVLRDLHDRNGETIDQAIITYFQAPHSFTGEDVVEISCHGSPVLLRQVMDVSLSLEARMADPGEFTLRALANGRIDLAEAEAIRDVIDAQTTASARQAVRQLGGELSRQLQPLKEDLLNVIVVLESALEFVEDDLPPAQLDSVRRNLITIATESSRLANTFKAGHLIRDGLRVAIVGRPNVGKSSLFNTLLGSERAIVTDIAGTTRDQLHERFTINEIPISLIDTAGLRETTDTVESIGVDRARTSMVDADLVIVMLDVSEPQSVEDDEILLSVRALDHIVVLNKIDKVDADQVDAAIKLLDNRTAVAISATSNLGLDELRDRILEPFAPQDVTNAGFLITDARHHDLLNRAKSEIDVALDNLDNNLSEEIVLVGLHNALRYLGEITGETTTEDMLTRIFSTFCIGK